MIYSICRQMIVLKNYTTKEEYQAILDSFLALQGLTLEQHTELTEMLKKNN